jgi:glucose-1-phosphate cytidylyltransferase
MKVVLFCGGQGMRMREYSESIPKPMVRIGHRPILWHVMRYYAHYGHKEFILCLGAMSEVIKNYFLNYDECASNDFVLSSGGSKISLLSSDIHDWRITFVDTGPTANVGQRLKAVQRHLEGESVFLANYADGLSDLPLPTLIDYFHAHEAVATFAAVKPPQSWHACDVAEDGYVTGVKAIGNSDVWMNGGFFVLKQEIFDYMEEGDELVVQPFERLIERRLLCAYKYEGFWGAMDTFKEKQRLDDMHARGNTPWEVWKNDPPLEAPRHLAVAGQGRRLGLIAERA